MNPFITYDVSARQDDVKNEMLKKGYWDRWNFDKKTYYLPNTSLWKQDIELQTALNDIYEIIKNLNSTKKPNQETILLLRCILTSNTPWVGISGTSVR